MSSVDVNLSQAERRILRFLLNTFKSQGTLPSIKEVQETLDIPYDKVIAEKMINQFLKRGIIGVGLNNDQKKILDFVLEQYSKSGKYFTAIELSQNLSVSLETLEKNLVKLNSLGLLVGGNSHNDTIVPSVMRMGFDNIAILDDGRQEKAGCAIDALGVPFMYDQDATIISKDPITEEEIKIEIREGEIRFQQPENLFVYFGSDCATILFFTSKTSLERWEEKNPSQSGITLDMDQALTLAKQLFENRLNLDFTLQGLAYDPVNKKIKLMNIS
ncbi:MAG: organomercurial lyase [Candidatus Thorarchaeota archaeon]